MSQKTLPFLYFALGLIVMRLLSSGPHTEAEIDLVTRLRQAGAI